MASAIRPKSSSPILSIVAHLANQWVKTDSAIHPFVTNSFTRLPCLLTGLALSYFLGSGILAWGYAVMGGVVSCIAMLGTVGAAKPWSVPAHTYPFILISWIFLLTTHGFAIPLQGALPRVDILPPAAAGLSGVQDFLLGVLHSVSQIYFKGNLVSAVLLILGLAVNSVAAAASAVLGSVIAVVAAHLLGVESELITSGVQGFSPVLTAIAFGSVFYPPSLRGVAYAGLATIATVIAQSALNVVLSPMALPPLSHRVDLFSRSGMREGRVFAKRLVSLPVPPVLAIPTSSRHLEGAQAGVGRWSKPCDAAYRAVELPLGVHPILVAHQAVTVKTAISEFMRSRPEPARPPEPRSCSRPHSAQPRRQGRGVCFPEQHGPSRLAFLLVLPTAAFRRSPPVAR
ncbi:MAG TPA: urea transporter [Roseiarcus sp.]|nr:urea transporter [Roseiarcus sp.]